MYYLCVLHGTGCKGFLFLKDWYGLFNTDIDLNESYVHEGKADTNESAQVLTQKNWKSPLPWSGVEPSPLDWQFAAEVNQPQTPVTIAFA